MDYLKSTLISSANMDLENNQLAFENRLKRLWISWIPIKPINYFKIPIQLFSIFKDFAFFYLVPRGERRGQRSLQFLYAAVGREGLTSFPSRASWPEKRRRKDLVQWHHLRQDFIAVRWTKAFPAYTCTACWCHKTLSNNEVIHAAWFTLQRLRKMLSLIILTEFGEA